MNRMLRYDQNGRKSYQLSIPLRRDDLLLSDSWRNIYQLAFEVSEWLKVNCTGDYRIIPSRRCCDIHFQSERDATLFWTFHA